MTRQASKNQMGKSREGHVVIVGATLQVALIRGKFMPLQNFPPYLVRHHMHHPKLTRSTW
jgi:hypothetical protein